MSIHSVGVIPCFALEIDGELLDPVNDMACNIPNYRLVRRQSYPYRLWLHWDNSTIFHYLTYLGIHDLILLSSEPVLICLKNKTTYRIRIVHLYFMYSTDITTTWKTAMYLMQMWHTSAYRKVINAMFEFWQQKFFCSIPRNPQLAANINNYGSVDK